VQISDNVNGAWTRAPGSTTYWGSGDIALYYVQNTKASSGGLTITVSASAGAYLTGAAAEYSGVATSGALDQVASGRNVSASVNVCAYPTSSCPGLGGAGELMYGAFVTGGSPGTVTPSSVGGRLHLPGQHVFRIGL
jgi:hypothetical protein